MLGLKEYEFEELVEEILPKMQVLNKFGVKMDFTMDNEHRQLIGNREQLFLALFWMRKYQTMQEMALLFDLAPV